MRLLHETTASAAPVWDVGGASLLWVADTAVHRLHPGSATHTETVVPQPIGAVAPRTNGGLIANLRDGIGLRDVDGKLTWLVYWHRDEATAGPAAVDPAGNFWAATGDQLVRVQPDGRAKVLRAGSPVTGLAWNPSGDRLYLATADGIDAFSGELGEPDRLCAGPAAGLCVDADGCVWAAMPAAQQIHRITPTGTIDHTVDVPAPTGCCFGGNDFADLYLAGRSILVAPGIGTGLPTARFPG